MPTTIVHGRKAVSITPPPPDPPVGDITIEVNFASAPSVASAAITDLKYDKQGVFNFEFDDRSPQTRDAFAYFHGGTAPINSTVYPGKTFTDGCGNNIKWRGAVATNAKLGGTDQDWVFYNSCLSWAEMATLVSNDWLPENHGYYHDKVNTYSNGENTTKNIDDNTRYIFTNLAANGVQFIPRIFVIPSADTGYIAPAEQLGYLASITQGDRDGYIARPEFNDQPLTIAALNGGEYALLGRSFKDFWDASAVTYYNGVIDTVYSGMASTSTATKKMWRLGGHFFDPGTPSEFSSWRSTMDHLETVSADRIWVTTAQELYEYMEVKRLAIITQVVSGSKLTVTIDLSKVPLENRFRDMSFKVTSDAAISSVVCTGDDSHSYNTGTKLINVFKKKTTGFKDPSTALAAPSLTVNYTSGDRLSVSYPAVPNATSYVIEVSTDNTFVTGVVATETTALTKVITGLNPTTTYYVRAYAKAPTYYNSIKTTGSAAVTGQLINLSKAGDGGILVTSPVVGATYTINSTQSPFEYLYFGTASSGATVGGTSPNRVTIKNINGQVVVRNSLKLENAKFIDVDGAGTVGTTYGFKATDPANPTVGGGGIEMLGLCHDITWDHFDVDLKVYIALIKNEAVMYPCDTSYWYPAMMSNLKFTNIRGTNIHQDGIYNGSSDPYGVSREVNCNSTISTTSQAIPTAHPTSVTITVGTGLSTNAQTGYVFGQLVQVKAGGGQFFRGTITSYNSGTGQLVISTTSNSGTGTFASWTVETILTPRPTGLQNVLYDGIIMNNIGRSGFQCGGTDGLTIKNFDITNCGYTLDIQQGAGIALGSACTNVTITDGNVDYTFKNAIYGYHYGLAHIQRVVTNHSGTVKVAGVDNVNSGIPAFFFNTFDVDNPSATNFDLMNCTIGSFTHTKALQLYIGASTFDYGTTSQICHNTIGGVPMVDSDIDKTQVIASGGSFSYIVC